MVVARRLTFRGKLMGIIGIAVLAFGALFASGAFLGERVERQLATIQEQYVPKLELEPRLDAEFERIARAFQDAVATHDEDMTIPAAAKSRFRDELEGARGAVDPAAADRLRAALDEYYVAAYDVSRRLLAGETGEGVVDAVAEMQRRQARVKELITRVAALDRHALAEAFAASARAGASARRYQLWIGIACLVPVLLLSLGLSRSVLRSVSALADGLARFGRGDFSRTIPVTTRDELGDVAQHANRMAASLERASLERARIEAALTVSNRELEAFSYSVAHDLRAPLRGINGFSRALLEDHAAQLDDEGKEFLGRIAAAAERMGQLIDALLALSRLSRTDLHREPVDLTRLADAVVQQLRSSQPGRVVEFVNHAGVVAHGDPRLLRAVLENLLGNAWKFTNARPAAHIEFGAEPPAREGGEETGESVYYVRDDGAGFDMAYAEKLFAPFQRLHTANEFAGTGIGLATVQRIVHRHGGRIWAEAAVGRGAKFQFTLPDAAEGALS